ncbi:hypothetical protein D558_0876 [Bordetella holmesii 44057]|nr:hypothetical protein D558_0876 [Bordetella holmesii 44057]
MIAAAIPSIWSYLLPLLSLLALVCLVVWGLGLAVSRGWRAAIRRHPWRALVLLLPLASLLAYGVAFAHSVWRYQQVVARQEAARALVLEHAQTIDGIAMPAGSRLQLQRAGHPESFVEAEFAQPVMVQGIAARRLARRVSTRYDAQSHAEIGSDVLSMSVFGDGPNVCMAGRVTPRCRSSSSSKVAVRYSSNARWLPAPPTPWPSLARACAPARVRPTPTVISIRIAGSSA